MLKSTERQIIEPAEQNVPSDKERLESYSNLLFDMVTKLGFVLPDLKYEDDPLRRKYQPSIDFKKCLVDIQKLLLTVYHLNGDILEFLRCRIGEWKLMTNQFLPLFIYLVQNHLSSSNSTLILLKIINMTLRDEGNDENSEKSAYYKDLVHYMAIYKKQFSHTSVMSSITSLLASTISSQADVALKYNTVAEILSLLLTLLAAPEASTEKGNLNLNLAYGKKETLLASMTCCKTIDIIFGISSAFENEDNGLPFNTAREFDIYQKTWSIISCIFRDVSADSIIDIKVGPKTGSAETEDRPIRKPIRHGRFSGSVSVRLSTGQTMVINNSVMFSSGMPGSLDATMRRNRKLEEKISAVQPMKKSYSSEDRRLYFKLSKDYLESHFNNLFCTARSRFEKTSFLPPNDVANYMEIAAYFMEFCRVYSRNGAYENDLFSLIYGIIDKKLLFSMIEHLHVTIVEKHYPLMLRLLRFYRELLMLIDAFSKSTIQERKSASDYLQKELFHSKTMLMVVKRVISCSKPVLKYFAHICLDCNNILFKLVDAYGVQHPYWFVSSSPQLFSQISNNDENCEAVQVLGAESNFSYARLIKHYSSRDIVDFYAALLANCQFETIDTNSKVAQFLYRVLKDPECMHALMRPSIIVQLQRVLSASLTWTLSNSDLITVSKKVVRNYCNLIKKDPMYLIESFFH